MISTRVGKHQCYRTPSLLCVEGGYRRDHILCPALPSLFFRQAILDIVSGRCGALQFLVMPNSCSCGILSVYACVCVYVWVCVHTSEYLCVLPFILCFAMKANAVFRHLMKCATLRMSNIWHLQFCFHLLAIHEGIYIFIYKSGKNICTSNN